jgi:hypothetical protein
LLDRARLEQLLNWAWDRYDWLSEWQRVGLGVVVTLALVASAMYCLGAASLLALSRQPAPPASAEAAPTATAPAGIDPVATEVNPISPLLADRTPTLRPTRGTVSPSGPVSGSTLVIASPTPSPTARGAPGVAGTAVPTAAQGVTGPRTPTPISIRTATPASARPTTPIGIRTSTPPPAALPWGNVPSPSPARGNSSLATPTTTGLRP